MRQGLKKYFGDIARTPILSLGIIIISAIAAYFETAYIIPMFAASLYTITLVEENELSSARNILFAHVISFLLAMLAPTIFNVSFQTMEGILIIAGIVFVAGLIQTVTKLEHPPAIAAILTLFEVEKSSAIIVAGFIPLNILISFSLGLGVVLLFARWMDKKKGKSDSSYF